MSAAPWKLGEGNTPLVAAVRVAEPGALSFKLESANPTGSYKDRFVAAELEHLLSIGARACVATSSGNTGSALATYCARAGLACVLIVNPGAPEGKLQQMSAHGAHVLSVPGFVTEAQVTGDVFAVLELLARQERIPLVVSAFAYCPVGMSGVQAIGTELAHTAPDHVFVPVGGGGLYSAIARSFQGSARPSPRVHAVQPRGCLTLVGAYLNGTAAIPIPESTTRISGLSVPLDLDASLGLALLRQCDGVGLAVSDDEVFAAQQELFLREGIYAEPAGAAAFAGWKQAVQAGEVRSGETSVCLVTGHGFKDPLSAARIASLRPARTVAPRSLRDGILQTLGGVHA